MEARMHHYSRPGVLRLDAPAASPAPGPATADAQAADCAFTSLNGTVMTILALLVCGLVALLALYVVLSCALRATRRACHNDDDVDVDGHPHAGSRRGSGTGKKKKPRRSALVQALPCLAYFAGLDLAGSSRSECAICLAEFARGERVRVLPRCNHGFHARCIDRWLAARPTCPTCRQAPFAEDHTVLAQPEAHRVEQPAGAVQLLRVVVVSDGIARHVEET